MLMHRAVIVELLHTRDNTQKRARKMKIGRNLEQRSKERRSCQENQENLSSVTKSSNSKDIKVAQMT